MKNSHKLENAGCSLLQEARYHTRLNSKKSLIICSKDRR